MTKSTIAFSAATFSLLLACSPTDSGGDVSPIWNGGGAASGGSAGSAGSFAPPSGGQSVSGGAPASGGTVGIGGSSVTVTGGSPQAGSGAAAVAEAGSASGGRASGGKAGSSAGNGGAPGSGGRTAAAGSGGAPIAGVGGASAAGAGGGTVSAEASAGCGKSGRPAGGSVTVQNDHIYSFPASYDGTKPFPLLIAFHACGNPIDQFLNLTKGSAFETEYVRAFPRSADSGGCWNYNSDISRATKIYDELMASYCIDKSRVFATGHSSGAQMVVQILTKKADAAHMNFRAVAPIAASDYGALSGPAAVMYVQGKTDSVRGNDGGTTVARFRTANGCGTGSTPYSPVMGCQSSGKTVNPGCISYEGCKAPTIWCAHDDPNYSNTYHGVPCFGIKAIYDFFQTFH